MTKISLASIIALSAFFVVIYTNMPHERVVGATTTQQVTFNNIDNSSEYVATERR